MIANKVFRDPIYGLISFSKEPPSTLLKLIDCEEVQRLKRIRQLGISYQTYPSAVHDRFSHSLGVAFLVGIIFDKIALSLNDSIEVKPSSGDKIILTKSQFKLLLQIAGLLHDIGHGPFSHTFERISQSKHEEWTVKLIASTESNINKILLELESPLRENIVTLLIDIYSGIFEPHWGKEIISSQIDADRMDYLLRDAYMCGVQYANFDRDWLINNMELRKIKPENNRDGIVINAVKGMYAVESFIISRYHMYEQVYFHKTTRGMEVLVRTIFERARELLKENSFDVNFINDAIKKVLLGNCSIDDYLLVDDFMMISQIKIWSQSKDKYLSSLSHSFIDRKPFKMCRERDGVPAVDPIVWTA